MEAQSQPVCVSTCSDAVLRIAMMTVNERIWRQRQPVRMRTERCVCGSDVGMAGVTKPERRDCAVSSLAVVGCRPRRLESVADAAC